MRFLIFSFIILLLGFLFNPIDFSIYAQPQDENMIQLYGCQEYYRTFHCDPMLNNIDSYFVTGQSKKIYESNIKFTEGINNQSIDLKKGDTLRIPPSDSLKFDDQMTLNVWLLFTELPDDERWIYEINNLFLLRTNLSGEESGITAILHIAGLKEPSVSVKLNEDDVGRWTMITMTYDDNKESENFRIFKNGVISDVETREGIIDKSNAWHKVGAHGGGHYSIGEIDAKIDDLRLYTRALNDSEIIEMYENPGNLHNIDKDDLSKVGHWTFDENLTDISSKKNHMQPLTDLIPSMVFSSDGRLFFTEKNSGNIKIMKNEKVIEDPFTTISDLYTAAEMGLLGITLDPDFEENHYVYVYHTYFNESTDLIFARIIRFTDSDNIGTNKTIIFDNIPATSGGGHHIGGAMAFGPDGNLYVTVGDGGGRSCSIPRSKLCHRKDSTVK